MLCAKSKVAPHKPCTIPRLELLAATLLANLASSVVEILNIPIDKLTYYTDSSIVLAWLKIEPYRLKTFVANRVSIIQAKTSVQHWKYVNTRENPADIISRGATPLELKNSHIWWCGPEFLTTGELSCTNPALEPGYNVLPELKREIQITLKVAETDLELIKNYSNFSKITKGSCLLYKIQDSCLN